jgi:DNA-binding GntR family transcriptional regulator
MVHLSDHAAVADPPGRSWLRGGFDSRVGLESAFAMPGANGESDQTELNSTTRVIALLRGAIIDGEFDPATKLRTEALAKRFGTSRSPVREALLALEREGLVEILPNRGAVVRHFDHRDLSELYELRCVLEPRVAARAASRIDAGGLDLLEQICVESERLSRRRSPPMASVLELDDRFHLAILGAADSRRLAEAMNSAFGIPHRLRWRFWSKPDLRARALAQHRQIMDALRTHNGRLANAAMELHLLDAYDVLDREFETEPAPQSGNSSRLDSHDTRRAPKGTLGSS